MLLKKRAPILGGNKFIKYKQVVSVYGLVYFQFLIVYSYLYVTNKT